MERTVAEFSGRITKVSQSQIRKLTQQGHGELLAIAARVSLNTDGEFLRTDIEALEDVDARKAQKIIELLTSEGMIAVSEEEEFGTFTDSPRRAFRPCCGCPGLRSR